MATSGKIHGKSANLQVTDAGGTLRDISGDVSDVDGLPGASEVADATGLGATAKAYLGGLNDVKFTVKGQFNDTALTGSHTVLSGIRGLSKAFQYAPAGTTTGFVKITGNAILTNYKLHSPLNAVVEFQADFQGNGDVTFGVF